MIFYVMKYYFAVQKSIQKVQKTCRTREDILRTSSTRLEFNFFKSTFPVAEEKLFPLRCSALNVFSTWTQVNDIRQTRDQVSVFGEISPYLRIPASRSRLQVPPHDFSREPCTQVQDIIDILCNLGQVKRLMYRVRQTVRWPRTWLVESHHLFKETGGNWGLLDQRRSPGVINIVNNIKCKCRQHVMPLRAVGAIFLQKQ